MLNVVASALKIASDAPGSAPADSMGSRTSRTSTRSALQQLATIFGKYECWNSLIAQIVTSQRPDVFQYLMCKRAWPGCKLMMRESPLSIAQYDGTKPVRSKVATLLSYPIS